MGQISFEMTHEQCLAMDKELAGSRISKVELKTFSTNSNRVGVHLFYEPAKRLHNTELLPVIEGLVARGIFTVYEARALLLTGGLPVSNEVEDDEDEDDDDYLEDEPSDTLAELKAETECHRRQLDHIAVVHREWHEYVIKKLNEYLNIRLPFDKYPLEAEPLKDDE